MAIVAVALGSSVMFIALATVSGFQNGIKEKVIGIQGHIIVDNLLNTEGSVPTPLAHKFEKLSNSIFQTSGILNVSACLIRPCIVRSEGEIDGMLAKGVDRNYNFDFFKRNLVSGKIPDFDKDTNQAIISEATSKRLNLKVGDKLQAIFFKEEIEGPQMARAIVPVICGIFATGLEEYDKSLVITYRGLLRKMLPKNESFTQWEIVLKDYNQAEAIKTSIEQKLPAGVFSVNTVQRYNRQIFDWLGLLDTNVIIILALMTLITSITMCTTLLILITERTQMVGVLKALGAANQSIRSIFIYQAIFIAATGLALGNILGLGVCFLQQKYAFIRLPVETYYVNHVLIDIEAWHVLAVNLGTLAICFVVLFLPAMIISKLTAVKTMRFQ